MATTDAKTGIRLPWGSNRSNSPERANEEPADSAEADTPWPVTDTAQGEPAAESTVEPAGQSDTPSEEQVSAVTSVPTPARKPAAKPTKFLADLTKAMQAAAEAAREQTLTQFQADAKTFVELIHERSANENTAIRATADEDIAGIRDWSKAEIARIREETERKISARKTDLEEELDAHAARIERQIEHVHSSVGSFEKEMATFFEELLEEPDPARFAAMAETLPEPPSFEDILPEAFEAQLAQGAATVEAEAATADVVEATAEAVASGTDTEGTAEAVAESETAEGWAQAEPEAGSAEGSAEPSTDASAGLEVPAELQDVDPSGEPVDRAAVMAALEAAAEAVTAAEWAAESATSAENSADVAETAVELLSGKVEGHDANGWPNADFGGAEAEAALAARMDANDGELEAEGTSFADRLASLMPRGETTGDPGETKSTQVIVVGLVSVASIASFKRHLGRVAGVQSVGVSSGPDGEFVFTVSHRADVSFRDVLPTLPGFAARVTNTGDGVVNVTARDPESES